MKKILVVSLLCYSVGCSDETSKEDPIIINNTVNSTTNNTSTTNNASNNTTSNNTSNNVSSNNIDDTFCPESARPIYAVEADVENPGSQGKLVKFDAQTLTFLEIGELNCPAEEDSTPFSMSVDRQGVAWVLYDTGDLFRVNTSDASCQATAYVAGQEDFYLFGMGFALNVPGEPQESLYIAGGFGPGEGQPRLGVLSFPDLQVTDLAPIDGWPEMSGTANAELWGFFPGSVPPRVARINGNGEELETIPVTGIDGDPNAWAFAHWGGKFWLFYKSQDDESTRVFKVERDPVSVEEVITNSGRYIVGAGVSTCAPTIFL